MVSAVMTYLHCHVPELLLGTQESTDIVVTISAAATGEITQGIIVGSYGEHDASSLLFVEDEISLPLISDPELLGGEVGVEVSAAEVGS